MISGTSDPSPRRQLRPRRVSVEAWHTAVRVLVAVLLSVLLDLVVWGASSKQLGGHINIVGYNTFLDYDGFNLFLKYRLATYAFPAGVILFYSLLAWLGPLRVERRVSRWQPLPLVIPGDVKIADPGAAEVATEVDPSPLGTTVLFRTLAPALVVVLASSVASRHTLPVIGWASVVCGCAYAGLVLTVARIVVFASGRRSTTLGDAVSGVNAIAEAVAAFGGLWFVSRHTEVLMSNGSVHRWAWLPWWLATLGVGAAWLWVIRGLRRGRSAVTIEQRLRVVLVGSVAMYLLTAEIATQTTYFQGFDDAQNLTGAYLLQHGYFPWRDFQFIHGFFADAVESLVGFHIFGENLWGSNAGIGLILAPLTWVSLYLLSVWGARRAALAILAPIFLAASASLGIDPRFIVLPLIWVLLGKALASRRLRWTCALTIALFIEAVAVPEADFQVLIAFVLILAVDMVHRQTGRPLTETLRRTLCFVVTGAILMIAWSTFLVSQHAFSGFIDWFKIFLPGHDVEGAIPPQPVGGFPSVMFKAMIALVVLTVLSAAWRVHRRQAWTPLAWVTLGAALNAGLYGEQAIGRYDAGHVTYSLDAALPMFVLVIVSALPAVDRFLFAQLAGSRRRFLRTRLLAQPASVVVLVVGVIAVPTVRASVLHMPGRTRTTVAPQIRPTELGYAAAGVPTPGLLGDLRSVLETYAPRNAPFFDMTNSPGYFYFLLGQRPAAPFTNISQAIPEGSQELLVSDLRKTRPPLVAFNSSTIGLPAWDFVENEVRHFDVSQYVLDGWRPLLVTQSVLFLLRDDLWSHRPAVPHLSPAPVTTDLYDSQPECDWGDSADFLQSDPAGPSVTIHASRAVTVGGATPIRNAEFRIPGHIPLWHFSLATFAATRQIGTSTLTFSDMASAPAGADITVNAIPVTGSRLAVRVGSCLQWHGFRGRTIYVGQQGGAPITSLTLSEVKG